MATAVTTTLGILTVTTTNNKLNSQPITTSNQKNVINRRRI